MRVTSTLKNILGPTQSAGLDDGARAVTIRYARADDALALMELAYLDSSRAPEGVVIVAEVGGRIWAARSLEDGHAIADPFRPSGELSFLLAERARQVQAALPERRERRIHRPLAA